MKSFSILILLVFIANVAYSQCNQAEPFCTGTTYTFPMETGTSAESGPDYACLATQPNPVWYYLLIDNPGNINIGISSPSGNDVDFICWGPFNSPTGPCTAALTSNCSFCPNNTSDPGFYPSGMTVDCSYDPAPYETCHIPNAQSGKYYILCITNYEDEPGTLTFTQTGGSGSTNCNIVFCEMHTLNAFPSNCMLGNKYNVIGQIVFEDPPATGQLIVTDNSGVNHIYNAPFTSPLSYNIDNIVADGLSHTITAYFTDAPTCSLTTSYMSPEPCGCIVNAGPDQSVCTLSTTLEAVIQATDINTNWTSPNAGVTFASPANPTSAVSVSSYGTYLLVWSVTNYLGETCSDTMSVAFNPIPVITADANLDTICSGEPIELSANGAGTGGSYVWSNGAGGGQTVTDYPLLPINYTVVGTDANNCVDSAFVYVFVHQSPIIDFVITDEHCRKSDGAIQANINGGLPPYTLLWSDSTNQPLLQNISAGTYSLTVTDLNNCHSTLSDQVFNIPGPNADFFTTPNRIYPLTPVTFIDYSAGNIVAWRWDFGDGMTDNIQSPTHIYAVVGYYPVKLWVNDNANCEDSVIKEVAVKEIYTFYLPNAISPNGNGVNDVFNPFATFIETTGYFLRIYNRWGQLVFSSTDINKPWDGTSNGELVPEGIYSYFIKFVDGDGLPHELMGHINVMY